MLLAVIRLRSGVEMKPDIRKTLESLRLDRVNHCVLVPKNPSTDGMLQKAKDYITWGNVKSETLARMILKRGKLVGDIPVTNQYIKDNTKYDSLIKFADAILTGKEKYSSLKEVKPIFRLHPPLKGYEGVKHAYSVGGALGYRGEEINKLLDRMLGPPEAGSRPVVDKEKAKPKEPAKKVPARKEPVKKEAEKKPAPKKEARKGVKKEAKK
jgi:large subunit ribosomal protein L30